MNCSRPLILLICNSLSKKKIQKKKSIMLDNPLAIDQNIIQLRRGFAV